MREFFEAHKKLLEPIRTFPFQDKRAYSEFLAQTHHYVVHTTRLLGLVASRIGPEREKLHSRFMKHAGEERSHHLLAEHDLRELGGDLASHPPLPATNALQECQYYRILYREPTMIFGHVVTLEGIAVVHGPWIYKAVVETFGASASTFVKLHAEDDPTHLDQTFNAIATLTPHEQDLVKENFIHSAGIYEDFLNAIIKRVGTRG